MQLSFTDAAFDRRELRDHYDLLLGVVATLSLCVDELVVYGEEMFPVVELRVALQYWTEAGLMNRQAFEFTSLEAEEEGLIYFRPEDPDLWRVGSVFLGAGGRPLVADGDLRAAVRGFIAEVDSWVEREMNVSVTAFLGLLR